jgi:hypothetical protein
LWSIAMTTSLVPTTALAYLRSLSTDVRAAAVLGPGGALLAGEPALADPAGSASPGRLSVRSDSHTLVVDAGPYALEAVLMADMRATLEALGGR